MKECPCKGCTQRFGGCHTKCPKEPQGYHTWKYQQELRTRAEAEWRDKHNLKSRGIFEFGSVKIY